MSSSVSSNQRICSMDLIKNHFPMPLKQSYHHFSADNCIMVIRVTWGIFGGSKALFSGFVKTSGFVYTGTNKVKYLWSERVPGASSEIIIQRNDTRRGSLLHLSCVIH